ncbi:MAG: methionyl-tRNA formyltransferase [Chitinophagaceae bacterium]|nr:MAG: methionyl-tRNA formyltransferase [Chitinophagaceae bacterium]
MGTPEFAVASLDALVQAGCHIVGVITAPDKEAGRGMQVQESAVKKYAVEKGFTILQPLKFRSPDFIEALKSLKADLQICVAFRMLPEMVWNMPPMGTINVHGSLLPKYRGAAPINWAVINGDTETGVTTFKLQHAIDTGNILLQKSFPISPEDNAGIVHDTMKEIGAELLLETIQQLSENKIVEKPQVEIPVDEKYVHAPKIFTETCLINFNKSAIEVNNLIRGLSPYPTAFTFLNDKKLKIFKAIPKQETHQKTIGSFNTDGKTFLDFACTDGWISVLELQLEGKKRMSVIDFLRGYRF